MVKKADVPKEKVKKPAAAKGGKAKGQEVKDQNTSKGVAPGSETPMSVDEVNPIPSQEGALQGASVIDTDMQMSSASAERNPLQSLEANTMQPGLPNEPPLA